MGTVHKSATLVTYPNGHESVRTTIIGPGGIAFKDMRAPKCRCAGIDGCKAVHDRAAAQGLTVAVAEPELTSDDECTVCREHFSGPHGVGCPFAD